MQLINPMQLSANDKVELIKRCKASARMRKGQNTTDTIDFKLKTVVIEGRFTNNCTVFSISRVTEIQAEINE